MEPVHNYLDDMKAGFLAGLIYNKTDFGLKNNTKPMIIIDYVDRINMDKDDLYFQLDEIENDIKTCQNLVYVFPHGSSYEKIQAKIEQLKLKRKALLDLNYANSR